ncbi:MAG: geranylgeranylglyceryl/heptaprenylglyceryl phosphate synthase [Thaumarchaeota archaeon]|jgi:phosphoglycerol geranylgeranyltransferase|nr:geranylgeranylglyceryl/heptaprenylglyceryl phosphate synthase [Candidatus Terraquivivens yellowstonensis]MCL7387450.1 geranylgeranylglyceryl/heptaprenylglyceryl phosphate synthase [Candidatus Terraquivivens yellowstonensis]MCL7392108.1 geranylgeranylglyceryl/heptaprenylglyceryl phosphate synthase [Candidatus Terraquivivens yellowstonensis]MCL7395070.1 geranylgeranylglyceryl/heptaprenylglyceryl phosphate synthase [Candidatus Terraquivivens yellowstonensis]MCL7398267.1 geranylgeranylglyceryl/h
MLKLGRVERYILEEIGKNGCIHMTLLDPENFSPQEIAKCAKMCEEQGTGAIMVGGSILHSQTTLDECVRMIKENVSIPVILFPNNVNAISKYADAIWFMSLLNSTDWYYIIGAQMQGSFLVKKYDLEAIPMGYLVFGSDTAVSAVGRALPLPLNKGEVAAGYALAAQYLGMRFVYLEAGSGAQNHIPPETIRAVRDVVDITIVVGGGITSPEHSYVVAKAGADVIVTGTVVEKSKNAELLSKIIQAAKEGAASRPWPKKTLSPIF